MNLFRRRRSVPAGLKPALEADERVLAWAAVSDTEILVATNRGLWLPGGRRLDWHEIHKAAWSGQELRITPAVVAEKREGYTVQADAPVESFRLPSPGELPDQVRTRVTRSVAYTTYHAMPTGGVRVVGRRVAGRDGLTWTVRYDSGTPVEVPAVVELTDELVASAQGATAPRD